MNVFYIFSSFILFSFVVSEEVLPEKRTDPKYPKHPPLPIYNEIPYSGTKKPYEYAYAVKDDYSGANFDASESSDGNTVNGYYSVLLPDGRRQLTEYTVNGYDGGYKVDVSYEGEAKPYHPPTNFYKPTHEALIPEPSITVYNPSQSKIVPAQAPQSPKYSYVPDIPKSNPNNLIAQPAVTVPSVPYPPPSKKLVTQPPALPLPTSYKPEGPYHSPSTTLFRQPPKEPVAIFHPVPTKSSKPTTFQGTFEEIELTTPIPNNRYSTTARSYVEKPSSKKVYGFKRIAPKTFQVTTPYPVPEIAATARTDSSDSKKTFDMAKNIAKKVYGFKFAEAESRKDTFPSFAEAESRRDTFSSFTMPF